MIVSNPPYVLESEKSRMHKNVLEYEPALALFVPDEDPLLFYRAISSFAAGALEPAGRLYFEINAALGDATADLVRSCGFGDVAVWKDISGRDRFVYAVRGRLP